MNNTNHLQMLPQQNIEAEQMVLGAILIENDSIKKVIEALSPDDFYKDSHRRIFQIMLDMHVAREAIDLVTLSDNLRGKTTMEGVGGASYLATLVSLVPTAANIKYYANIVREKSALRKLEHIAQDILARVHEGKTDSNAIAHEVIQATKNSRTSDEVVIQPFREIVLAGINHIEKRHESGKRVFGVPTGISDLDDHTDGMYPGESWLVAARPGKGKTAFSLGVAGHAASQGFKVGVVNLEMGPEQLGIRSLASKSNLPITRLRKGLIDVRGRTALANSASILYELQIFVCSTAFTLEQIEHATDKLVDDHGCDLIVYDYLQIIRPGRTTRDKNREQEVAEISRMIKSKAMCPGSRFAAMPLAQLNREADKRPGKRPQLSDLRESGALENDADNVILIHQYECTCSWDLPCGCGNRNRMDFIVAKGRNSGTAVIEAVFDPLTASFCNKVDTHPRD